jgi:hypothetical protein
MKMNKRVQWAFSFGAIMALIAALLAVILMGDGKKRLLSVERVAKKPPCFLESSLL